MTMLKVESLSVDFLSRTGRVKAVNDVSFDVAEGETFGIIGESGSGKSVISLAILRLLPMNAQIKGSISFYGRDVLALSPSEMRVIRGRQISLMPQNPAMSLNPVLKNGRQLFEVLELVGVSRDERQKTSVDLLRKLMLQEPARLLKQYPHQLSGGMKQRLLAAIALSYRPKLLIADEPTKGLDPASRRGSIELFDNIKKEHGRTMIVITHDLDLAQEICDRIAVMYAGEIVEIGAAERVINAPSHPYTKGLIKALPRNGLVPLEGQSPSRVDMPGGCLFHDRCVYCSTDCTEKHPEMKKFDGGVVRCHLCS